MPLQIINDNPIGAGIGTALGEGFSSGVGTMAQYKLQQMFDKQQKEQKYNVLAPIIGEKQARLAVEYPQFLQNPELLFNFGGQQAQQQSQNFLPQSLQQIQAPQQPQQNQLQDILQQLQSPGGTSQLLARTNLGLEQQQPVQNQPIAQQQMQQAIQQQNVPPLDIQQPQGQVIRGALSKQKPGQEAINQGLIERRNAPYTKTHEGRYEYAKDASLLAKQMLDLLNTGKVESGAVGGFFGTRAQNAETQQFNSKGKELAILNAGKGRGPATDFKIRTAQETKPLLEQKQQAQYELLYDLLDKVSPELKEHDIIERLTLANNGLEPENLKNQVAIQKMLPNPEDYQPNTVIKSHGKIFAVDPSGLKWNLIKG